MQRDGFSLVELLVTVTIAGVLLGSAVLVLNPDGVSTTQAARALSAHLNKTRFEAIESNRNAHLTVDASGSGAYTVWVDEDEDGTRDDAEVLERVVFGSGDLGRLTLQVRNLSGGSVSFDRRGVPLVAVTTTVFTVQGGGRSQSVALSSSGRPSLQ